MDDKSKQQMNETKEFVSLNERELLIRNTGVFQTWGISEIGMLAGMMKEVQIQAGTVIVNEGELIDSIYLIAHGSAEVTKQLTIDEKTGTGFLAVLSDGEWIGLNNVTLYSETGMRTATVTATSFCILLRINIADLNQFYAEHPNLVNTMGSALSNILKMRLIKESAPFAQLSNQRLFWMVGLVKEEQFPAKTIIFKQGDISDKCYMVYEGQVEIIQQLPNGEEKSLVVLEQGALFGEGALLIESSRNATAYALSTCTLLVLDKDLLLELSQQHTTASTVFLSMLSDRNCPIRHENIIHQQRTLSDGEVITTLKNPEDNTYCQLNEKEWFIWKHLNGKLTIPEITQLTRNKWESLNINYVVQTIQMLTDEGFAHLDVRNVLLKGKTEQTARARFSPFNWFQWIHFVKKSNQFAGTLHRYIGFWLLNIPMALFFGCILLIGIVLFSLNLSNAIDLIKITNRFPLWILGAFFFSMVCGLLNPIIKIITIKHFKHDVPNIGLIWHGIGPKIYVDTTDLLMGSRKSSIMVNGLGIMANLVIAGLLSCYAYYYKTLDTSLFYWLTALFLYLNTLRELNPMLNLDGYILLMDVLGAPKLREQALILLSKKTDTSIKKQYSLKKHRSTLIFWIACLLYLIVNIVIAAVFMNHFIEYWPKLGLLFLPILLLIALEFLTEIHIEYHLQKRLEQNSREVPV